MIAVRIPDAVLAAVEAHACEAFPHECCGYLRGHQSGNEVDEVVRCRNAQTDGEHPTHPERGAETGFVITGTELFAFAKTFQTDRPAAIVYHSHTNGRAYFSAVERSRSDETASERTAVTASSCAVRRASRSSGWTSSTRDVPESSSAS